MKQTLIRTLLAVGALSLVALPGCSDKKPPKRPVEGKSFLLDAEALDLETIVGLVKDNKAQSAEQLEKMINEDNGINNVDLDNDDQIDFVMVREERKGDDTVLNFSAVPSSKGSTEDAVVVANLTVGPTKAGGEEIRVRGGYPSYVRGYDSHYYHYNTSRSALATLGTAAFVVWALNHTRPVYYAPMVPAYYAPRPIYTTSSRTTRRTTFRNTTRVSPVKKQAKPSNFSVSGSPTKARKAKSTFGSSSAPKSTRLSDRKGKASSFKKTTGPKAAGTGFGSGSRTATKPTTAKPTSPSRPNTGSSFGRSSGSTGRSSGSSGSSFGRSSGSRSSGSSGSFGRSSGSRSSGSRSFGGGRRRR